MHRIASIALLLWALHGAAVAATLYRDFTWIDPTQRRVLPDQALVTQDGLIAYIGPADAVPARWLDENTPSISLQRHYVVPGLVDTHAHMGLGAVAASLQDGQVVMQANNSMDIARHNGLVMLAHGITSVRNPGGDTEFNVAHRDRVAAGEMPGPRVYTAGALIDTAPFPGLSVAVESAAAVQAEVHKQQQQGVDFIKFYVGLDETLLKAGIEAARQVGLPSVAHLHEVSWTRGAQLGLDGVVHAMPLSPDVLTAAARGPYLESHRGGAFDFFEWYEAVDFESAPMRDMLATVARQGLQVDPTLIVFYNTFHGDSQGVIAHPDLSLVHPESLRNWREFFTFNVGWQDADFQRARAVWPKVEWLIRRLHGAGVALSVGTDVGNPWVIPGVSLHQEMALLVNAGVPIWDVLAMATEGGAQITGQAHSAGRLQVGRRADFAVLARNPLEGIENSRSVVAVVQGGVHHSSESLLKRAGLR